MGLTLTLHLVAGIGAAILAVGILAHDPRGWRPRAFGALCAAIAVWHLGRAGYVASGQHVVWRVVFLAGSFATLPAAVNFALALARQGWPVRRRWTLVPTAAAVGLWITGAWTPFGVGQNWPWVAAGVSGAILVAALAVVLRESLANRPGPRSRALGWVVVAGTVVAVGGITDFLPRESSMPDLGPLATLLFLAIVCAVFLRHRLLDIDRFVLRIVGLVALSAGAALLFRLATSQVDAGFLGIFLVSLVVVGLSAVLAVAIRAGEHTRRRHGDPVVRVLTDVSGRLAATRSLAEVRAVVAAGSEELPPPVWLALGLDSDGVPLDLLVEEGFLTRRFLEDERIDARGSRRIALESALERMSSGQQDLVVPAIGASGPSGWIALGGPVPDRYLNEAVVAAVRAVANQVAAAQERIELFDAARRREALAALGELAAGLAHEIRNPVAAIRGAGQALGPRATDRQRCEMLEVIEEESRRLDRFLEDFMDYARPGDAGKHSTDLSSVVEDALRGLRAEGARLSADVAAGENVSPVLGDPEQLRRIVDNLLRNAHEAAGDGVSVRITIAGASRNRVALTVEDDGPGIPDEELPHVLKPFHTTRPEGTGLGLPLVQRLVESMSGTLHVEGRPGVGARFEIVLPAARS